MIFIILIICLLANMYCIDIVMNFVQYLDFLLLFQVQWWNKTAAQLLTF